jgi:hypothetical protein
MEAVIKSENSLRVAGMQLLIKGFGSINAERFINCVKNEHFDYTEWQRDLWKDKTIEEIHQAAADFFAKNNP